ncbi:MAG: ribosome-associated translation inhibitor RaiA [Chloroflexi bacterium]|nr:ribosome-associated translation inhibitor RaiA [Chloroflexota bacterium]
MEVQLAGTNIEVNPAVQEYAQRKLGKLGRHLSSIMETRIEMSEEKTKAAEQRCLVRVTVSAKGTTFHGEERGIDFFEAIDKVSAIMIRQLNDFKGKAYERGRRTPPLKEIAAEKVVAAPAPQPPREIARVKRFVMKPMTFAEAVEQMETLGHSFFLYLDAKTDMLKLIYRRKDGDYGLIEPILE